MDLGISYNKANKIDLFLNDLRQQSNGEIINRRIAAIKFKQLSIREKDYYEVTARRMNEVNKDRMDVRDDSVKFLNDHLDAEKKKESWEKQSFNEILQIPDNHDVITKNFVIVNASGTEFYHNKERRFAIAEICLVKFNFAHGISQVVTLFPELNNITFGFRQEIYENIEEVAGWNPNVMRYNHSLSICFEEIDKILDCCDELFVPMGTNQFHVALAMLTMYKDFGRKCPWISSINDWGTSGCRIFKFEQLIYSILFNKSDRNPSQNLSVSTIVNMWKECNLKVAPECCLQHKHYGTAEQCVTNVLLKFLYMAIVLVHQSYKSEMKDVRHLVSELFLNNLEYIMTIGDNTNDYNEEDDPELLWKNLFFEKSGIETIIENVHGVSITQRSHKFPIQSAPKRLYFGRGRGQSREGNGNNNIFWPGAQTEKRKLKIPLVIC